MKKRARRGYRARMLQVAKENDLAFAVDSFRALTSGEPPASVNAHEPGDFFEEPEGGDPEGITEPSGFAEMYERGYDR